MRAIVGFTQMTLASAGLAADPPKPPVAARKPHQLYSPNGTRENDGCYYMRCEKGADSPIARRRGGALDQRGVAR